MTTVARAASLYSMLACLISVVLTSTSSNAQEELERLPAVTQLQDYPSGRGLAAGGAMRSYRPVVVDVIKHFENFEEKPYDDAFMKDNGGACTIGYGHVIKPYGKYKNKGFCADIDPKTDPRLSSYEIPISEENARELLMKDIADAQYYISVYVKTELDIDQYGGLVSFVYNIGYYKFVKQSTAYKLLIPQNATRYPGVAQNFLEWDGKGEESIPGLVRRRRCEFKLFVGDLTTFPDRFKPDIHCRLSRSLTRRVRNRFDVYAGILSPQD